MTRVRGFRGPAGPGLSLEDHISAGLSRLLDERGVEVAERERRSVPFGGWVEGVPDRGVPLDFKEFAFQRELYGEACAHDTEVVVSKATQVGVSTWAVRLALYQADVHGRVIVYAFPSDRDVASFSKQRVKPAIADSPVLRARIPHGAIASAEQLQVGKGWIYFRGTNKPIDSIDADVLIFDEYDTSDQKHIAESEYRLSGLQSAGLTRRLGVPSIPGFGIDALYEASDQRVWTVRCRSCRRWNPIRGYEAFTENVDQETCRLVCAKCRRAIDVRTGEWVAKHPDRDVRGYHVPKLLIPAKKQLARVIANSRKTREYEVTAFHNRDLAEPHAPSSGHLSLENVLACVREDLRPVDPAAASPATHMLRTMGVDVAEARALNVTIEESIDENRGRKLWVGPVDDDGEMSAWERLSWLMDRFGIHMCCVDNEPSGRAARAFAERHPGRVYRADLTTPSSSGRSEPSSWTVNDDERFVSLWRTRAYDAVFERYRMQRVLLPPLELLPWDNARGRSEFAAHLGNLYRRVSDATRSVDGVKVATGAVNVVYVRTGPEDYAQCEAYNLAAIELFYRNAGLARAAGAQPVRLVDELDFVPLDLAGYGDEEYRPGFE